MIFEKKISKKYDFVWPVKKYDFAWPVWPSTNPVETVPALLSSVQPSRTANEREGEECLEVEGAKT